MNMIGWKGWIITETRVWMNISSFVSFLPMFPSEYGVSSTPPNKHTKGLKEWRLECLNTIDSICPTHWHDDLEANQSTRPKRTAKQRERSPMRPYLFCCRRHTIAGCLTSPPSLRNVFFSFILIWNITISGPSLGFLWQASSYLNQHPHCLLLYSGCIQDGRWPNSKQGWWFCRVLSAKKRHSETAGLKLQSKCQKIEEAACVESHLPFSFQKLNNSYACTLCIALFLQVSLFFVLVLFFDYSTMTLYLIVASV